MKSKAIIIAIAATLSLGSLSAFAQDGRGGPGRGDQRADQRGPQDRDGRGFDNRGGPRGVDNRNDRRDDNRFDNRGNGGPRGFDNHRDARNDRNFGARGPQFQRGNRIPPEYRNRTYYVTDYRAHRLQAPPRGQQWVQVGADYALIAIATGVIASIVLNN